MQKALLAAVVAVGIIFSGVAFAADGAKVYKSKCAACHGPNGQGTPMAPAFKGNEFIKKASDDEIKNVILKGRMGAAKKYKKFPAPMMPQKLSDAEVKAVISYIKGLH